MNKKAYALYSIILLAALLLAICAMSLLLPDEEFSVSERRKLAQLPELTLQSAADGSFAQDFEKYSVDQFPLRDGFRRIKATAQYDIFRLKDNNGIYIAQGYAAKCVYPLDEASVESAAQKFGDIYEKYFADDSGRVVVCVVPDKGIYLGPENGYPCIELSRMQSILREAMPYAQLCDISDTLSIDDYYRTDTHWRQEKLLPTAKKLAESLGVELSEEYTAQDAGVDFYGVYYGQSALPLPPERISYVTSDSISQAVAHYPETGRTGGIYDHEVLYGRDPYDFFLGGASPVVTIENPAAEDRRLVIFRDSFASAIAPYLIEGYSRIALIDTRYISPELLEDYAELKDSDVLFLYSTLVLNQSETLR